MHQVLFVDPVCPKPYDGRTLETQPQGGTESSVTRVAEALAGRGHRVMVMQHNRAAREEIRRVEYIPFGTNTGFVPTHVVTLRSTDLLDAVSQQAPEARQYVWYTDYPEAGERFNRSAEAHLRNGAAAITLSQWHTTQFESILRSSGYTEPVKIEQIYLPIPDDLGPNDTPVVPNKFVFFASPHKGRKETLELFARFKEYPELRDVRLHVANPGYRPGNVGAADGRVVYLGPLPWRRVIREVRSAFLVLHCNRTHPETFGLVHAEANAVGTPWIAGYIGANPEVASHPEQMIDLEHPEPVIERIIRWRNEGRPEVRARDDFRISKIVTEWEEMFSRN